MRFALWFYSQFLVKGIAVLTNGPMSNIMRRLLFSFSSALPFEALARAGETVIHVGVWKIETVSQWSRIVGDKGKVVIVEAIKENIDALKFEAKRRSLNNVVFINGGVWHRKEELLIMVHKGTYVNEGSGGMEGLDMGQLFMHSKIKEAGTYIDERTPEYSVNYIEEKINVDTLDNLLKEIGITVVDHIHLTITGSEYEAILGMEELLKRRGVRLVVSATFLRKEDNRPSHEVVQKLLKEKGLRTCLGRRFSGRHGRYVFAYRG